jgi:hypothetical protein
LTLSATTLGLVHGVWRAGIAFTLACSHTCLATARVQLPAADARRLGLSRSGHPLTVGHRSVRLWANQPRHVAFRLRPAALPAARRLRLVLTAADIAGSRARIERNLFDTELGSPMVTHIASRGAGRARG